MRYFLFCQLKKKLYLPRKKFINQNPIIMKKLFTLVLTVFAVFALNAQNAKIILEAHDVWGDGTGYQILIDADNVEWTSTYGPNCGSAYTDWEYMIPANASANDANVVSDGAETLLIPAGTYSYLILNPGCSGYGKNYIASSQVDPTNTADFVFEANKTYHFVAAMGPNGQNDCVTLTVTDGIVGVAEVENTTFTVYPNPATTSIKVTGEGEAVISNILGQTITSATVNGVAEINVSNLESGVYFINMNGVSKKFIKK